MRIPRDKTEYYHTFFKDETQLTTIPELQRWLDEYADVVPDTLDLPLTWEESFDDYCDEIIRERRFFTV